MQEIKRTIKKAIKSGETFTYNGEDFHFILKGKDNVILYQNGKFEFNYYTNNVDFWTGVVEYLVRDLLPF